jgi:hypothetical protein
LAIPPAARHRLGSLSHCHPRDVYTSASAGVPSGKSAAEIDRFGRDPIGRARRKTPDRVSAIRVPVPRGNLPAELTEWAGLPYASPRSQPMGWGDGRILTALEAPQARHRSGSRSDGSAALTRTEVEAEVRGAGSARPPARAGAPRPSAARSVISEVVRQAKSRVLAGAVRRPEIRQLREWWAVGSTPSEPLRVSSSEPA